MELSNLTEQMKSNEQLLEQLQDDLNTERDMRMKMIEKCLEERGIQTEIIEEQKKIETSTNQVPEMTHEVVVKEEEIEEEEKATSSKLAVLSQQSTSNNTTSCVNNELDDDAINNHPKVLYEDELILFKEKCSSLSMENVQLHREIDELRSNMSQFSTNHLHNLMLKYLVPVLICFIAYVFYLVK
jgi:hypothetical protein